MIIIIVKNTLKSYKKKHLSPVLLSTKTAPLLSCLLLIKLYCTEFYPSRYYDHSTMVAQSSKRRSPTTEVMGSSPVSNI